MILLDGPTIAHVIRSEGISHLVWIPDSSLGCWESVLPSIEGLEVIRPAREGEAIGIAAGLLLGGRRPIVAIQCTGFFEAGDALRNFVHDFGLPLFFIIGYRSFFERQKNSTDTAPLFTEPILKAWQLSYTLIDRPEQIDQIGGIYRNSFERGQPHAILLAE